MLLLFISSYFIIISRMNICASFLIQSSSPNYAHVRIFAFQIFPFSNPLEINFLILISDFPERNYESYFRVVLGGVN